MRPARLLTAVCALLWAGCLVPEHDPGDELLDPAPLPLSHFPVVVVEGGEMLLDCRDAAGPVAHALFECDSVTLYACNRMADAVVEYEGGARQRFADLRVQTGTFTGRGVHEGRRIVSVSVETESGPDALLTQHFAAPVDSCGAPVSAQ
jgi:hypothetical protein